jgi:hypothetical protein
MRAASTTETGVRSTSVTSRIATPSTTAPAKPKSDRSTSPSTSPMRPPGRCPPKTCSLGMARCKSAQPMNTMTSVDAMVAAPSRPRRPLKRRRAARPSSMGSSHAATPNAVASALARPVPTGPTRLSPPAASYDQSERPISRAHVAAKMPSTSCRRPVADGTGSLTAGGRGRDLVCADVVVCEAKCVPSHIQAIWSGALGSRNRGGPTSGVPRCPRPSSRDS